MPFYTVSEQAQRTLGDHLDQNPGLKRQRDLLVSIADATAVAVLAELLDVMQFSGARRVSREMRPLRAAPICFFVKPPA